MNTPTPVSGAGVDVKLNKFERVRGHVPSVASLPEPDDLCMLNIADKKASRLTADGNSSVRKGDPNCRAPAARGISLVALCEITRRLSDFQPW